jgi:hypothetical protein
VAVDRCVLEGDGSCPGVGADGVPFPYELLLYMYDDRRGMATH